MMETEMPYEFPMAWQDDERLYNKVIDHLLELDQEEQATFLLKILKKEKRSNRSRVVHRVKQLI